MSVNHVQNAINLQKEHVVQEGLSEQVTLEKRIKDDQKRKEQQNKIQKVENQKDESDIQKLLTHQSDFF